MPFAVKFEVTLPDVTPEDGVAVQAFIEAVYRSIDLGVRVHPRELIAAVVG